MKYNIVMRTKDRTPKKNYIIETLKSFFANNDDLDLLNKFIIQCDNGKHEFITYNTEFEKLRNEKLFIHCNLILLTPNLNASEALCIEQNSETIYTIFIEDDIIFCKDFLKEVDWYVKELKNFICLTFHCPYKEILEEKKKNNYFWKYPLEKFYGTQCFLMHSFNMQEFGKFIKLFANEKNIKNLKMKYNSNGSTPMIYKCLDFWLKEFIYYKFKQEYIYATVPSLVQHIGVESTLGNKFHENQSFNFEV